MKMQLKLFLISTFILVGASSITLAEGNHTIVPAPEIKWGPGPKAVPAGAQLAVLYGDPAKEGLFAMRLKFPDGYRIPPHTHPAYEVVTVMSGTINLGMSETVDDAKTQALPAGSFFALSPGMAHYIKATGETVVQISTNGPWGLMYINPKDDPRQTQ